MAHNRTRLAKMKAATRRRELEGSSPVSSGATAATQPSAVPLPSLNHSSPAGPTWRQIFGYDSTLIYRDLLKTVLVTLGILGVILGLRWLV